MSSSLNPIHNIQNVFSSYKNSVNDLLNGHIKDSLIASVPQATGGLIGNANEKSTPPPPIQPYNFGTPGVGGVASIPGGTFLGYPANMLPGSFTNPAYGAPSMQGFGYSYYGGTPIIPEGGYYNQMAQMGAGPSYSPVGTSWMQSPIPWGSGKGGTVGGLPQPPQASTPTKPVQQTGGGNKMAQIQASLASSIPHDLAREFSGIRTRLR